MVTFINKRLIPISTPFLVQESSRESYMKHLLLCRLFLIIQRKILTKKIFKIESLPKKFARSGPLWSSPKIRDDRIWSCMGQSHTCIKDIWTDMCMGLHVLYACLWDWRMGQSHMSMGPSIRVYRMPGMHIKASYNWAGCSQKLGLNWPWLSHL